MYYKAIDRWNSPSLAHHGVKGMKWGVRHDRLRNAAARTGRVVRVAGGAVKKSATTIAKGIWRAGSAVRRFKNRRAIKSADVNRILKRANKMNNQELSDALTRVQLKNQISNQNRGGNSRSLGETVANSLKDKAANMAANALNTSVDSLLRGELPTTGLIRNAEAQKALQEKQISENKMNKITNDYKIDNSYLQNKLNVSGINAKIASNNLAEARDRQSLRDLNNDSSLDLTKNTISSIKHTVTLPDGKRAVQRSLNSSNSYLYAPLSEATKYRYKPQSDTSYKVASYITNMYPKDLKHFDMKVSDLDNYLAHYGVKGMKWGIRHDRRSSGSRSRRYGESHAMPTQSKKKILTNSLASIATGAALIGVNVPMYLAAGMVHPGFIAMGAVLAATGTKSLIELGIDREGKSLANRSSEKVDKKTGLHLKEKEMTQKEDAKAVNPGYKLMDQNKHSNCMLCTTAYDIRRRGYDVIAGNASYGYTPDDLKKWYNIKNNDIKHDDFSNYSTKEQLLGNPLYKSAMKTISSEKNSRGNFMCSWSDDMGNYCGGHSMAYEVSNGKVTIIDGQTGKVLSDMATKKMFRHIMDTDIVRLDNKEPNYKYLKQEGIIK